MSNVNIENNGTIQSQDDSSGFKYCPKENCCLFEEHLAGDLLPFDRGFIFKNENGETSVFASDEGFSIEENLPIFKLYKLNDEGDWKSFGDAVYWDYYPDDEVQIANFIIGYDYEFAGEWRPCNG